ncbi:MAG: hypothetical protein PVG51_14285, partial [Desulfosarcina sp.]
RHTIGAIPAPDRVRLILPATIDMVTFIAKDVLRKGAIIGKRLQMRYRFRRGTCGAAAYFFKTARTARAMVSRR